MKINSHNEWDKILEVVVGTGDKMPMALEFSPEKPVTEELFKKAVSIAKKAYPDWYRDEINEDLNALAKIFTDFGAKVMRPKPYGTEKLFCTPDWCASGEDIYNVRDIHLVVGDKVIVGPSSAKFRYFEPMSFNEIWYNYFEKGFKWIAAPRPRLIGEYVIPYYVKGQEEITEEDVLHAKLGGGIVETWHRLTEDEILFDAANVMRLGKDLIYLISCTGNRLGAKWLEEILGGEYRVHATSTYRSSHLDSTILPLHPGLVLLNGARVKPETCPEILKGWDKIYFNDMAPTSQEEIDFHKNIKLKVYDELKQLGVESNLNSMSSPWAGLNVMMLDPKTVLVQNRQTNLIKELEKHKLTVIPVSMRHTYTMLGGLHCTTLDTVREGKLENYFD